MRLSCVATAIACIVLLLLPASDAWVCNVTLVGNTRAPQRLDFSEASIRCNATRASENNQTLSVGADISLARATFAGKRQLCTCWQASLNIHELDQENQCRKCCSRALYVCISPCLICICLFISYTHVALTFAFASWHIGVGMHIHHAAA